MVVSQCDAAIQCCNAMMQHQIPKPFPNGSLVTHMQTSCHSVNASMLCCDAVLQWNVAMQYRRQSCMAIHPRKVRDASKADLGASQVDFASGSPVNRCKIFSRAEMKCCNPMPQCNAPMPCSNTMLQCSGAMPCSKAMIQCNAMMQCNAVMQCIDAMQRRAAQ